MKNTLQFTMGDKQVPVVYDPPTSSFRVIERIALIKMVMDATGASLIKAKDAVNQINQTLNTLAPDVNGMKRDIKQSLENLTTEQLMTLKETVTIMSQTCLTDIDRRWS